MFHFLDIRYVCSNLLKQLTGYVIGIDIHVFDFLPGSLINFLVVSLVKLSTGMLYCILFTGCLKYVINNVQYTELINQFVPCTAHIMAWDHRTGFTYQIREDIVIISQFRSRLQVDRIEHDII